MTVPAYDLALAELEKCENPIQKILSNSAYWIPLQFVYLQMTKNKDIVRLSELPAERKTELWNMVARFDWPQWKKINVAQSIYVYQFIKQDQ